MSYISRSFERGGLRKCFRRFLFRAGSIVLPYLHWLYSIRILRDIESIRKEAVQLKAYLQEQEAVVSQVRNDTMLPFVCLEAFPLKLR